MKDKVVVVVPQWAQQVPYYLGFVVLKVCKTMTNLLPSKMSEVFLIIIYSFIVSGWLVSNKIKAFSSTFPKIIY